MTLPPDDPAHVPGFDPDSPLYNSGDEHCVIPEVYFAIAARCLAMTLQHEDHPGGVLAACVLTGLRQDPLLGLTEEALGFEIDPVALLTATTMLFTNLVEQVSQQPPPQGVFEQIVHNQLYQLALEKRDPATVSHTTESMVSEIEEMLRHQ